MEEGPGRKTGPFVFLPSRVRKKGPGRETGPLLSSPSAFLTYLLAATGVRSLSSSRRTRQWLVTGSKIHSVR